jgi:ABC-type nitrate/sulfonate/bicarbonate transport system substrate-binding protein
MRRKILPSSLILFLLFITGSCSKPTNPEIIFADASTVWWTAPTIIAKTHKLYEKNNLVVKTYDVINGLESKNAVISKSADIGLVASTPLAIGASKKEDILILGSYVDSSKLISIVYRNKQDNNILPEPIGYVPGTISHFYYLQYLKKHNLVHLKDKMNMLAVRPPSMPIIFQKKEANTAIIWEPLASLITNPPSKSPETNINEIRDSSLYTLRLYLVTRSDVWEKKRELVEKFLKSIQDACAEINSKDSDIRKEIERQFGYPENWLKDIWEEVDFSFKNDLENMKSLILKDAQLAIEANILQKEPDVDYMFSVLK